MNNSESPCCTGGGGDISTACCHCNTPRTVCGGSPQIKQEMQLILPLPSWSVPSSVPGTFAIDGCVS